ncbi:MAG: type II secretion system protein [Candidatus Roizmanbacteria bacterium]|nr:type II secretion system protein [Candidatus Roizmanbacteria bacterium]
MDKNGFTLIEISLVMAISVILMTLTTISLISYQQNTYVQTSIEQLMSDIKYQQISAMNGATEGEISAQRFGIHFDTNSYTLFHGDTYNALEPTNFTVSLDHNLSFASVEFAQNELLFERGSGEILNFVDGENTITVQDGGNNTQVEIAINKLGTITQIQ